MAQVQADPTKEASDDDDDREYTSLLGDRPHRTQRDGEDTDTRQPACGPSCQLSPKWRCLKNLVLHSISTFLIFTSFMTFQSLDSTLNAKRGLGEFSFTVLYGGFIISCVLAPAIVRLAGSKDTMTLSFILQLVFALSHFYPRFYTLLPSSLLLGLLLGPFWTAQGVYIVSLSKTFSDITGVQYETSVSRFYGVFNFFYMSAQKFGNLMESLILGRNVTHSAVPTSPEPCGAAYCGSTNNTQRANVANPDQFYVSLLVITFAAMCFLGIIVKAGFVDSLPASPTDAGEDQEERVGRTGHRIPSMRTILRDVTPTFLVHSKNRMYLLVPLFIYSGLQQGFVYGDYTKAFIACELGIDKIGYGMLVYGYADALSSLLVGWLERLTGRAALFTAATLIQATLVLFMQFWTFPPGDHWVIYALPGFWGMADAIWQTTTSSMVGTLFFDCRDSAFACFRMWQAAGLAVSFACSHAVCTWIKLYIILGTMVPALVSFYVLDILRRKARREGYQSL